MRCACVEVLSFTIFSSNFTVMFKNLFISVLMLTVCCSLFAGTPAEDVVEKYKDMKGARNLVARGIMMKMARPLMKDYQIAPLAHKVEELSVLRMDKTSPEIRQQFLKDLYEALSKYEYGGKSDTKDGIVDAYVHISGSDVADELVVYNPELCILYSCSGEFTRSELEKIQKKPE